MRIFLDTNVLAGAAATRGLCADVLREVLTSHELLISEYVLGQIDFLHAFRTISLSMLKRAVERPIFNSKYNIRVVIPEDIIGLKVQAMSNDRSRELLEYADIQLLMDRFGEKLNWKLIGEYFKLFKKEERYEKFKKEYSKAK